MPKHEEFDIVEATASVCAAYRINNNSWVKDSYTQPSESDELPGKAITANKIIAIDILKNDPDKILEQDRTMAESVLVEARAILFKMIGSRVNEFEQKIATLVQGEIIKSYDFGLLAFLPKMLADNVRRREADEKMREASGELPALSTKINMEVEILKCWYSEKWYTYYITAVTVGEEHARPVSFAQRNPLEIGSRCNITGTVKDHRNGIARLVRVKLLV